MTTFRHGGKSYRLEADAEGRFKVYRSSRAGLAEVHGVTAFRVVSAYRRKLLGERVPRRPRVYARRPKPYRSKR